MRPHYVYLAFGTILTGKLGGFDSYELANEAAKDMAAKLYNNSSAIVTDAAGNNKVEYVGRIMIDTDN